MAQPIRVGIAGAGWPGKKHGEGYRAAGGFEIVAVADLIPARRIAMMSEFAIAREYADYADLLADPGIDAVSICLPNHLHFPATVAALKARKHVICETPPFLNAGEARKAHTAAMRSKKVFMYAAQRMFGAGALAARQAIDKGYLGAVHHASARWMRTRGIPRGTGWFTRREQSGGGALIDLGLPMLDLAWKLLGQPRPLAVFMLQGQPPTGALDSSGGGEGKFDVETSAFALLSFENGKSMELAVSWAINQPPRHHGTVCRISGDAGAVELDTPEGPVLYRGFGPGGKAKEISLKTPKVVLYHAMMREFKECIAGKSATNCGSEQAIVLMQMIDAAYRSAETGRSVEIRGAAKA